MKAPAEDDRRQVRGGALTALIRESGLLQSWWADRLGVSGGTVSNWLSGKHLPKEEVVADALEAAAELQLSPETRAALESTLSADARLGVGARGPGLAAVGSAPKLAVLGRKLDALKREDPEGFETLVTAFLRQTEAWGAHGDVVRPVFELLEAWGPIRDRGAGALILADLNDAAKRAKWAAAGAELVVYLQQERSYVTSLFQDLTRGLRAGDRYDTVSNLDFWSSHNLDGRRTFMEVQERAACETGVAIRRVFLVPLDRSLTSDEASQLRGHAEVSCIEARVHLVRRNVIPDLGNFVLTGPAEGYNELYTLRFRELPDSGVRELDRVTLSTDSDEIARRADVFDNLFRKASSLPTYLEQLDGAASV
jgi:transcriptional regulator with XRE-family HTH domain